MARAGSTLALGFIGLGGYGVRTYYYDTREHARYGDISDDIGQNGRVR